MSTIRWNGRRWVAYNHPAARSWLDGLTEGDGAWVRRHLDLAFLDPDQREAIVALEREVQQARSAAEERRIGASIRRWERVLLCCKVVTGVGLLVLACWVVADIMRGG